MTRVNIRWLSVLLAVATSASAGKAAKGPPDLSREHVHASGVFSFRTPEHWQLANVPGKPEAIEVGDGTLLVRFVYRADDSGYDSQHANCMLERLAGPMESQPQVQYEYDFVFGALDRRRTLDSAFVVRYDNKVLGHNEWRQRNLTLVGSGTSLCAIAYAPVKVWKHSREARALLDAVLGSLKFR